MAFPRLAAVFRDEAVALCIPAPEIYGECKELNVGKYNIISYSVYVYVSVSVSVSVSIYMNVYDV